MAEHLFQFLEKLLSKKEFKSYKEKFYSRYSKEKNYKPNKNAEVVKFTRKISKKPELIFFKDELLKDIIKAYDTTIDKTYDFLIQEMPEDERRDHIQRFDEEIDTLTAKVKKHKEASNYSFIEEYLTKVSEYLEDNFRYIELDRNITETSLNKSSSHHFPNINNNASKKTIHSFKWLIKSEENLLKLYTLLNEKEIISNVDFPEFCKVFKEFPLKECPKIKWLIIGKSKVVSKPSLFYFIDSLIDQKLVAITDFQYKIIEKVFTDKHGNPLRNIPESKSDYLNKTDRTPSKKSEIDSIVKQLSK